MRTPFLVAAACAALLPGAALAQDSVIVQLLGKAVEIFKEKGYADTGWQQLGELQQGETRQITLKLTGGNDYLVVGVCDGDCKDMNLQLLDIGGSEVDSDTEDDDVPVVAASASGTYSARVTMVACSKSPCAFGLKAFRK